MINFTLEFAEYTPTLQEGEGRELKYLEFLTDNTMNTPGTLNMLRQSWN